MVFLGIVFDVVMLFGWVIVQVLLCVIVDLFWLLVLIVLVVVCMVCFYFVWVGVV